MLVYYNYVIYLHSSISHTQLKSENVEMNVLQAEIFQILLFKLRMDAR